MTDTDPHSATRSMTLFRLSASETINIFIGNHDRMSSAAFVSHSVVSFSRSQAIFVRFFFFLSPRSH